MKNLSKNLFKNLTRHNQNIIINWIIMQFIEKGFHTDKLLFIVTTEQN